MEGDATGCDTRTPRHFDAASIATKPSLSKNSPFSNRVFDAERTSHEARPVKLFDLSKAKSGLDPLFFVLGRDLVSQSVTGRPRQKAKTACASRLPISLVSKPSRRCFVTAAL
jgi:hypothetical protein